MNVAVPRETAAGENRVAATPETAARLTKAGLAVQIEAGAGLRAGFRDAEYAQAGAKLVADRGELLRSADVILQVWAPSAHPQTGMTDAELLHAGQTIIGLAKPLTACREVQALAERGVMLFAMELVPRITKAQAMDALSSQATVAGYRAVLLAAFHLRRMFPLLMTAAGTISPTHVFVIGAGVAGLEAAAISKRLGAVVEAYDIRPAVKEQVQSVGAKFVELPLETTGAEAAGGYAKAMGEDFYRRQRELLAQVVARNDVVITTASVPGKPAPKLITADMVRSMRPGSIIVDLAAEQGGNCELTQLGKTVTEGDVAVVGPDNLPATVPYHASQMYARNVAALLLHLVKDGSLKIDPAEPVTAGTLATCDGKVVHPMILECIKTTNPQG